MNCRDFSSTANRLPVGKFTVRVSFIAEPILGVGGIPWVVDRICLLVCVAGGVVWPRGSRV